MAMKFNNKKLEELYNQIVPCVPEGFTAEASDTGVTFSGHVAVGVKGIDATVECTERLVKAKGLQTYQYPITQESVAMFQDEMAKKHPGYNAFAIGQNYSFSKMFTIEGPKDAATRVAATLEAMKDSTAMFEDICVNFLEKAPESQPKEENFDPEKNVSLVSVDDTYHAVLTSEKDSESYHDRHSSFSESEFEAIASKYGMERTGDIALLEDAGDGRSIRCVLDKDDGSITIAVSVPAEEDVGAMYVSYISSNYKEMMCSYSAKRKEFSIQQFIFPDEYMPGEAGKAVEDGMAAMAACINEFSHNLKKRDTADFASDMQKILEEQTAGVAEREEAVARREEEMAAKEREMEEREAALQEQVAGLQEERERLTREAQAERERIQEKEAKMQEEIQGYEERNTSDILQIQRLAAQVAALQNKQEALGRGEGGSKEEVFKLQSKVQQLTSQKIALEKKLNEKIEEKEGRIRQLNDALSKKDVELRKAITEQDDIVKSRVNDELKKTEEYVRALESQVQNIGHTLTVTEMKQAMEDMADGANIKEAHAKNANALIHIDGNIEVRVMFPDSGLNYVEVSKEKETPDTNLRKLNERFRDIKFFCKSGKTAARAYFSSSAEPQDVVDLIDKISANFNK